MPTSMSPGLNTTILRRTLHGAALVLLTLASGEARANEDTKVTFEDDILPIFQNSCLKCHNPEKTKAGLDLSAYDTTLQGSDGGEVVQPGAPDDSLLLQVILHDEEPVMPPKSDRLPDSDSDLIRRWIDGNALESRDSKVTVAKEEPTEILKDLPRFEGPAPLPHDVSIEPFFRAPRPNSIVSLATSPTAPLVAIGGHRQIALYNTLTLEPVGILPLPEGGPDSLRFSRDGRLLIAGGGVPGKSGLAVAFDIVTGKRALEIAGEYDSVLAADIDPSHDLIAIGGPNRLVKIFNARTGEKLHTLKKHTDWVTAAAFSSDGKLLITGDRVGGLTVWESDSGQAVFDLTGQKSRITGLSTVADFVISSSEDGSIWVWELRDGKKVKSWQAHKNGALSVALTPDGRVVTAGRDRKAKLWERGGKHLKDFKAFEDVALQVGFSEGRVIAGDWTGAVKIWNAENGEELGELDSNPPGIAERIQAATGNREAARQSHEALSRKVEDKAQALKDAEAKLATAGLNPPDSPARIATIQKKIADLRPILTESQKQLEQATRQLAAATAVLEKWKTAAAREKQLSAELQ